jgi:hypothetical protein
MVKLTLNYIDEMIYDSYLYYHNAYILTIFHFNIKIKTFINIKDSLLIIKLFRFSPVIACARFSKR